MGTSAADLEALRLKVEAGIATAAEVQEYQLKDGTRVRRPDPATLDALRRDLAAEEGAATGGFFVPVQFGSAG